MEKLEVDEEVRSILVDNFEVWIEDLEREINKHLETMRKAGNVDVLMHAKKELLMTLVDNLPIRAEECYFCLKDIYRMVWSPPFCDNCEYAKFHGECGTPESDWNKISSAQNNLLDALNHYVYMGETFNVPLDEQVKAKVVANIEEHMKRYVSIIKGYIAMMSEHRSVEDLMLTKQRLLKYMIAHLPLTVQYCYFCMIDGLQGLLAETCKKCVYAKTHGQCGSKASTYMNIINRAADLLHALDDYYKGEKYEV